MVLVTQWADRIKLHCRSFSAPLRLSSLCVLSVRLHNHGSLHYRPDSFNAEAQEPQRRESRPRTSDKIIVDPKLNDPNAMNDENTKRKIRDLHKALLDAWNRRDAKAMAALLSEDGVVIGFDGTTHQGPTALETELSQIFAHHQTPAYVAKVRDLQFLSADVALLTAVAGMVPAGSSSIVPALNAVQSLVAVRSGDRWRIALFQNTPAAFHGRPELSDALTKELQSLLPK